MKRDCLCGHMWATHRQWNECHAPGCGCLMYRPKPRRPWPWFPHRPPAGGGAGLPRPAAETATPQAAVPPAGSAPARAASDASPPPGPGTTRWVHDVRYREAACRCFEVINHIHGTRRISRCTRHAFEAEWERRYAQS